MLHIHTVGMIGQEVLGQQGVRDCACDQIGDGHDGCLSLVWLRAIGLEWVVDCGIITQQKYLEPPLVL